MTAILVLDGARHVYVGRARIGGQGSSLPACIAITTRWQSNFSAEVRRPMVTRRAVKAVAHLCATRSTLRTWRLSNQRDLPSCRAGRVGRMGPVRLAASQSRQPLRPRIALSASSSVAQRLSSESGTEIPSSCRGEDHLCVAWLCPLWEPTTLTPMNHHPAFGTAGRQRSRKIPRVCGRLAVVHPSVDNFRGVRHNYLLIGVWAN